MNYLMDEKNEYLEVDKRSATSKAREDIKKILIKEKCKIVYKQFRDLEAFTFWGKVKREFFRNVNWHNFYKKYKYKKGDFVFFQYPVIDFSLGFLFILKKFKSENINTVVIVHDAESLRYNNNKLIRMKEFQVFKNASIIVLHNKKMAQWFIECGIDSNKIICLDIFDYLISSEKFFQHAIIGGIDIAGNLSPMKCGYIYEINDQMHLNLYGVGYKKNNKKFNYFGSFNPEELPFILIGGFGLVWDGNSVDTCSGQYGNYLRYNNPHKTSLYLASGEPVIVWKESAMADFIIKNNCGFTIGSIREINDVLSKMTNEEYEVMRRNAISIGKKLRKGYFTKCAFNEVKNRLKSKTEDL